MARTIRFTGAHGMLKSFWNEHVSLFMMTMFSTFGSPAIGNGGTAGRLRTTAAITGRVAGVEVTKASTDDLWDLHSETATAAATFRAYWLYINAAGTASFAAGTDSASAAAALAALPTPDDAKCIVGVYVAGASTNFANALAAQGTIYNGIPAGAKLGASGGLAQLHLAPLNVTLTKG